MQQRQHRFAAPFGGGGPQAGNAFDIVQHLAAVLLLQQLKQQYRSKVLDNNERTAGLWAAAAKWGSGAMLPLLHEAGCRHLAWVYSPERYSQLSAQLAVEHTTTGITILTFQDLDTASGWLRRV